MRYFKDACINVMGGDMRGMLFEILYVARANNVSEVA